MKIYIKCEQCGHKKVKITDQTSQKSGKLTICSCTNCGFQMNTKELFKEIQNKP